MAKLKRISPRKEPMQKRSIELRDAILKAATYVLKKEGPLGFTTNKVADRAGVNIASLYAYYPNKESILFHLVEIEWSTTFKTVFPILEDTSKTSRERLELFIEKFYETEADESALNQAVGMAGMIIENTKEYQQLVNQTESAFTKFLSGALKNASKADLKKKADFILHTISSFSECMQTDGWSDFHADARMMSEMLCQYFGIRE